MKVNFYNFSCHSLGNKGYTLLYIGEQNKKQGTK